VSREEAAATRERILEAAGTLFREHGFDGIGVADIMKRAGLTHGGFYGHFASKDDLAAEITGRVVSRHGWMQRLSGKANPSLKDVVRQPTAVRRAFTEGLKNRVDALRDLIPGRSATARRRRALATMCGMVGALTLSRAVDDPRLSAEILDAAADMFGRR